MIWNSLHIKGSSHCWFYRFRWAGDIDDQKSTSSFVFCLGSGPITWSCKKQHAHTLSSTKVDYKAIVLAGQEVLWLR